MNFATEIQNQLYKLIFGMLNVGVTSIMMLRLQKKLGCPTFMLILMGSCLHVGCAIATPSFIWDWLCNLIYLLPSIDCSHYHQVAHLLYVLKNGIQNLKRFYKKAAKKLPSDYTCSPNYFDTVIKGVTYVIKGCYTYKMF